MESPVKEYDYKNFDFKIYNPWDYYLNLILSKTSSPNISMSTPREDIEKNQIIIDIQKNQQNIKEVATQNQSRLDTAESLLQNVKTLAEQTASVSTSEDDKYRKNLEILNQQVQDLVESFEIEKSLYKTQMSALQKTFNKSSKDVEDKILEKFNNFMMEVENLNNKSSKNSADILETNTSLVNLKTSLSVFKTETNLKFDENTKIQNENVKILTDLIDSKNNTAEQNFIKKLNEEISKKQSETQNIVDGLDAKIQNNKNAFGPLLEKINNKVESEDFRLYKQNNDLSVLENNSSHQSNKKDIEKINKNLENFVNVENFNKTNDSVESIFSKLPDLSKKIDKVEDYQKTLTSDIKNLGISKTTEINNLETILSQKINATNFNLDQQQLKTSKEIVEVLKNYDTTDVVNGKLKSIQSGVEINNKKINEATENISLNIENLAKIQTKLNDVESFSSKSIEKLQNDVASNKIVDFENKLEKIAQESKKYTESQTSTRVLKSEFDDFKNSSGPTIKENSNNIDSIKIKQKEIDAEIIKKANSVDVVGLITTINTKTDKTNFEKENLKTKTLLEKTQQSINKKLDVETFESYKNSNKSEIGFLVTALGNKASTSEINIKFANIGFSIAKKLDISEFTEKMKNIEETSTGLSADIKNISSDNSKLSDEIKKNGNKINDIISNTTTTKTILNTTRTQLARVNKRNNAKFTEIEEKIKKIPLQVNLFQIGVYTKAEESSLKFVFVAMFTGKLEKLFTSFRDVDGIVGANTFEVEVFKDVGYPLKLQLKHEEVYEFETPLTITSKETLRFVFTFNVRKESNFSFLVNNFSLGFRVDESLQQQPSTDIDVVPLPTE